MLQVKNVKKQYRTGTLVQQALDGVSLNLRDNEFVAILGPSGSGKTTLLNVIGGLDRYDSGELIINGLTTKKYKDKDWDYYRNHTIGFVFQSYNLIPHQSVLANVELALTISGISGSEKKQRALDALEQVGLKEHAHKKPSQLSGGQMQRVAIARALINDPDIVLADEPTGALDSETSIQVMNLLKEVAKDRLVVMVTHNPELAQEYATRIITIKDGKLLSDTNPYIVDGSEGIVQKTGKSSMNFLTALTLSFQNLRTKKARTFLVAAAGSIGIIGIALIMSLSNGVNQYIDDTEREAMSEYPLQISSLGYDLDSMISTAQDEVRSEAQGNSESEDGEVGVTNTITSMYTGVRENDLASFKEYLESGKSDIDEYARAISYIYNVSPQIYQVDDNTPYRLSAETSSSYSMMSMMSTSYSTFFQLPDDEDLYIEQYDIKAGKWPTNEFETVLVLSSSGNVTDSFLYRIGMKDRTEYQEMLDALSNDQTITIQDDNTTYTYDDFLNVSFQVLSSSDYYSYNEEHNFWVDQSDNDAYILSQLEDAPTIKIVGVVQPKEDVKATMLSTGIGYTPDLTRYVMEKAAESEVVKAQMENKDINVFTGKEFDSDGDSDDFTLSDLITFNEDALTNGFQIDTSALNTSSIDLSAIDVSGAFSPDMFANAMPTFTADQFQRILQSANLTISTEQLSSLVTNLWNDYFTQYPDTLTNFNNGLVTYLQTDEARNIINNKINQILQPLTDQVLNEEQITQLINTIMQDFPQYVIDNDLGSVPFAQQLQSYLNAPSTQAIIQSAISDLQTAASNITFTEADVTDLVNQLVQGYNQYASQNQLTSTDDVVNTFVTWMSSEQAQTIIMNALQEIIDTDALTQAFANEMNASMQDMSNALSTAMTQAMNQVISQLSASMTSLSTSFTDMFSFDTDAFSNMIQVNTDAANMQSLLASMMSSSQSSYDQNLTLLGYADWDTPYEIQIYPKNFDAKASIKAIIEDYNNQVQANGDEEKVIVYTDLVATMMNSVTNIVNTISYVLIAFVAISLIVSSIMIGVITYISVLERRKEIGILRALGASKHNITQVFNAETFITGFFAGLIGVGTALLLLIPSNQIIHAVVESDDINASLPIQAGIGLIILSIILTLIAGLMPARKAAKSDPVTALRTE